MEKIPSLAGQPAFFTLNQLFLMREGVRKVEAMAPIVKDLKDDDLDRAVRALRQACRPSAATSRSTRNWSSAAQEIAAQQRCGSCHLPTLAGQEQMPRVAKQRIDYLIEVLKSYRDNPRPGADTAMSAAGRRTAATPTSWRSRITPRRCSGLPPRCLPLRFHPQPGKGQAKGQAMIGKRIYSGFASEENVGYARAAVVDDWVFVSGTTGFDPDTKEFPPDAVSQCENCFRNIERALKEAGTGLENLVRVQIFLANEEDFARVAPVIRKHCYAGAADQHHGVRPHGHAADAGRDRGDREDCAVDRGFLRRTGRKLSPSP